MKALANRINHPGTTGTREHRKIRKPLMEKKRRARINTCLEELKDMLLEGKHNIICPQGRKPMKLEKADILEMTVKHVKDLQEDAKLKEDAFLRFEAGFFECMREVRQCLANMNDLDPCIRERLSCHLQKCSDHLLPPAQVEDGKFRYRPHLYPILTGGPIIVDHGSLSSPALRNPSPQYPQRGSSAITFIQPFNHEHGPVCGHASPPNKISGKVTEIRSKSTTLTQTTLQGAHRLHQEERLLHNGQPGDIEGQHVSPSQSNDMGMNLCRKRVRESSFVHHDPSSSMFSSPPPSSSASLTSSPSRLTCLSSSAASSGDECSTCDDEPHMVSPRASRDPSSTPLGCAQADEGNRNREHRRQRGWNERGNDDCWVDLSPVKGSHGNNDGASDDEGREGDNRGCSPVWRPW